MSGTTLKNTGAITGDDVSEYRKEKARAKAQGKQTLGEAVANVVANTAPKPASDPVAQANLVLASAVAAGITGKPLEDLKRTLLASLSQAAGIHVVAFPHNVDGVPAGFRAMDIRVIIPNQPTVGPQSGRLGFLNASLRGVWNGKPLTMECKLYEYRPDQNETQEEQTKRRARAVTEARFTVPQ